jgi:amino acid transporter
MLGAAAALVVDYTLTVAVSTTAGTAALTSAFPALSPATVPICLAVLAVITLLNLRGLGYAARAFLLPTIMVVLALAANTSFGGLPVLASRHAFEACATCSLLGARWYREPAEAGASR